MITLLGLNKINKGLVRCRNEASVHSIAKELKRTRGAIIAQLIRNGLIDRERWTENVLPRSDCEDTTTCITSSI